MATGVGVTDNPVPIVCADGRTLHLLYQTGYNRRWYLRPDVVASVFSDDEGRTWSGGEIVARHSEEIPNPNETTAAELADGRVLFSLHNESPRNLRLQAVSPDGATRWSPPEYKSELYEPICFASLIRLTWPGAGRPGVLLYSSPVTQPEIRRIFAGCQRSQRREDLTLRASVDDRATWPAARLVGPGSAGYSELAIAPDCTSSEMDQGTGIASAAPDRRGQPLHLPTDVPHLRFGEPALMEFALPGRGVVGARVA